MKRFFSRFLPGILATAIVSLATVWFGYPALSQVYNFNVLALTVSADGGFFGNMNIQGTCTGPGCGLTNPYTGNFQDLGTFIGDGGALASLTMEGASATGAPGIAQGTASTPQLIRGNAAATGGIGIILDNLTTQTGGTLASFRTGGTEKFNVDFGGNLNLTTGSTITVTPASTTLLLQGNAAAAGNGVNIAGGGTIAATGVIAQFTAAGTDEFHISARGHLCPISTTPGAPSAASFATGYKGSGAVNTISMGGSDASMVLRFTTGAAATTQILQTTSLFGTLTLNQAYSNANGWNCIAAYASPPTNTSTTYGAQDEAPLACVPTGTNTFVVYPEIPFTPTAATAYAISIFTMGAGSTY